MVGSELIKVENEFSFKITCQIQEGEKKKRHTVQDYGENLDLLSHSATFPPSDQDAKAFLCKVGKKGAE